MSLAGGCGLSLYIILSTTNVFIADGRENVSVNVNVVTYDTRYISLGEQGLLNSFSAELFKIDSSMFKIGRHHFSCNNNFGIFL